MWPDQSEQAQLHPPDVGKSHFQATVVISLVAPISIAVAIVEFRFGKKSDVKQSLVQRMLGNLF
jgi:hypothetical protein